jgi:hypothetical protein
VPFVTAWFTPLRLSWSGGRVGQSSPSALVRVTGACTDWRVQAHACTGVQRRPRTCTLVQLSSATLSLITCISLRPAPLSCGSGDRPAPVQAWTQQRRNRSSCRALRALLYQPFVRLGSAAHAAANSVAVAAARAAPLAPRRTRPGPRPRPSPQPAMSRSETVLGNLRQVGAGGAAAALRFLRVRGRPQLQRGCAGRLHARAHDGAGGSCEPRQVSKTLGQRRCLAAQATVRANMTAHHVAISGSPAAGQCILRLPRHAQRGVLVRGGRHCILFHMGAGTAAAGRD